MKQFWQIGRGRVLATCYLLLATLPGTVQAQVVAERGYSPGRFWAGTGVIVGTNAAVMIGLNQLWYADYERGAFRWHNDWPNWRQQDKLGHLAASWHIARGVGAYGRWSGLSPAQAGLYGAAVSVVFQSQIEVLDGFSEAWGASAGDVLFNTIGAVAGGLQVAYPEANAVTLKYSYHRSPNADPSESYAGNMLKDYDGASFWLVARPHELGVAGWPEWLGISIGHSADGLANALPTPESPHRRVWLIGPDFDFFRTINWPAPWLQRTADVLSFIRIPAPALKISSDGVVGYVLYW